MRRSLVLILSTLAALAACNNDDPATATPVAPAPPAAPATVSIGGTAAVGAALVGSTVTARCAGGAPVAPTTTGTNGAWTLTLASAAVLPCGLELSGGTANGAANTQPLHSYATAAGVVNLTPLTDLTLALAAGATPEAWFAGLSASHPPALGATLAAARAQVLQALGTAGYTLPAGSAFDPLTAAFSASAGNPYDALLDAFASGLAASGKSYTQLLTEVLGAAAGGVGINFPTFGANVPTTPGGGSQSGSIVLVAKGSIQPADIATLVGRYQGTLASTTATGQAPVLSSSCSIDVTASGTMTVAAGGRSLGAPVNGDVGDLILTINSGVAKAVAFDFNSGVNVTIEVVRGYVATATATDASGKVSCTLPNPHLTSVGTSTVAQTNGATAADIAGSLVGTYVNGSCTVTVSNSGTVRIVSGAVDVTGTLGGDEQDLTSVITIPNYAVEVLETEDLGADGRRTTISFARTAANASLGQPAQYSADARITDPRPFQTLANCQGLTRQ